MKSHPHKPASNVDELPIVVLNDPGTAYQFKSPAATGVPNAFHSCVETGRQSFPLAGGLCELEMLTRIDHGLISFRSDGTMLGIGLLVWEEFGPEPIWEQFLRLHQDWMKRSNLRPMAPAMRPESTPWVAISIAPGFFTSESPILVRTVIAAIWGVAESTYRRQFQMSLFN